MKKMAKTSIKLEKHKKEIQNNPKNKFFGFTSKSHITEKIVLKT